MSTRETAAPRATLRDLRSRLVNWLTGSAYPLWSRNGIDPVNGGFIELLGQNGRGLGEARRARVQPRQVYAFAQAPRFGWQGDARTIVRRGLEYFLTYYLRADGLIRTLAGVDGAPLDERALLYDHAFALLGYAAAAEVLDARSEFEARALALRAAIDLKFRAPNGAFYSVETPGPIATVVIESNPHMHLLEACLAWGRIGRDAGWTDWCRQIVELAMQKFIHPVSGALGESFTADWRPAPGLAGRLVEPGHQFEWAWLLLGSQNRPPDALRNAAFKLIEIGERCGVHRGVAVNALDGLSVHDPKARCWPQTERLKAALGAAQLTGEDRYWWMADAAGASLLPYLDTPVAGLWFDVRLPTGEFVDSPAPASTFYHLVGAIVALDQALAAT